MLAEKKVGAKVPELRLVRGGKLTDQNRAEEVVAESFKVTAPIESGEFSEPRKGAVEPLTRDQVVALRDYFLGRREYFASLAINRRNYLYIVLGFNLHRRCGDMVRMRIGDVVAADGQIRDYAIFNEEKTGKRAVVYLAASSRRAIVEYLGEIGEYRADDWLFPNFKRPGEHMSVQGMRKMLKRAAEDLGMEIHIGTHSLRKGYAYEAINSATSVADEIMVSQDLNHRDIRTTYAYIGRKQCEMDEYLQRNSL